MLTLYTHYNRSRAVDFTSALVVGIALLALAFVALLRCHGDYTTTTLTTNTVPKASGPASLADSAITDSAGTVAMAEALSMTAHQIHNVTDPSAAQDAATQAYVLAHAGSLAIGEPISGSSAHSVLFVDSTGHLSQAPTQFVFNAPNLIAVTPSATDGPFYTQATATTGTPALGFLDNTGAFVGYMGWFNTAYAFTQFAAKWGWFSFNSADIIFGNATTGMFTFGMTTGSAFEEIANGNSAPTGTLTRGRARYESTTTPTWGKLAGEGSLQVSLSGGGYADILTSWGWSTNLSITACGLGPSYLDNGRFIAITLGTGATSCAISWPSALHSCVVSQRSGTATPYTVSAATLTVTAVAGAIIDANCE